MKDLTLQIFNVDGRTLRTIPVTSVQTVIERNGLAAGIYFYKLTGKDIISTGKLTIQ